MFAFVFFTCAVAYDADIYAMISAYFADADSASQPCFYVASATFMLP